MLGAGAVNLLRQAIKLGFGYYLSIRRTEDFESLDDYPLPVFSRSPEKIEPGRQARSR